MSTDREAAVRELLRGRLGLISAALDLMDEEGMRELAPLLQDVLDAAEESVQRSNPQVSLMRN